MKQTFVFVDDIASDKQNNEKVAQTFTDNTGIEPLAILSQAKLEELKHKKGAFKLENISPTNDNSGKVACDQTFSQLMRNRQKASLSQRLKDTGEWEPSNIWFVVLGIVLLIAALFFQSYVKRYNAEVVQLDKAHQLAKANAWNNPIVPGPLNINMNEWRNSTAAATTADSITKAVEAIEKNIETVTDSLKTQKESFVSSIDKQKKHNSDSVHLSLVTMSQSIMDSAKHFTNKDANSLRHLEEEQKRAAKLLGTETQVTKAINAHLVTTSDSGQKAFDQMIASIESTGKKTTDQLSARIPHVHAYKYDLTKENPDTETSGRWSMLQIGAFVIGVLCLLGFIVYFLYVLSKVDKAESETVSYTARNLRAMAFPGNHSGGSGTCTVSFTLSGTTKELIRSVLIRYKWNALCLPDAFEFAERLKGNEALVETTKQSAPEPMFYAIESNMVVVYSGIGEKPAEEPVISLLANNAVNEHQNGNGSETGGDRKRVL